MSIEDSLEQRASGGDKRALEALLREHARSIYEVCRYIVGRSDVEDAAQASLERIVRSITKFDPERGSFRAWALTVTRNVCRDRLRRRGVKRRHFSDEPAEDAQEFVPSEVPGPERIALARIESKKLVAALDTLPDKMRLAIVLFHVEGASYKDIAATLEVPIGTVMTWLHRGRKRLRKALEAEA